MATEKQLTEVLEKISQDANGFIAASLVDLESGMTLAVKTSRTEFDLAAASAYNSELVKQKLKIARTLGLTGYRLELTSPLAPVGHASPAVACR